MKKTFNLVLILISLFSIEAKSQYFASIGNFRPNNDLRFINKPAASFEIGYLSKFEEDTPFRFGVGGQYIRMKPRSELFRQVGFINGNPYELNVKYNSNTFAFLNFYSDYAFVNRDYLNCFAGIGIGGGIFMSEFVSNSIYVNADVIDSNYMFNLKIRAGIEYTINDYITLQASGCYYGFKFFGSSRYSAHDFAIGLLLNFE